MPEHPWALATRAERYMSNTLGVLLDLFKRQWHRLLLALPACWPLRNVRQEHFPLTSGQIERLCDAIVASIDQDAVCRLASYHSGELPCQIRSIDRGSYNVSICLEFFGKIPQRLLRIPLQPALRDAWTKVQSEVATLAYIREHTSVSVPRVWAYGKDARVTTDPSAAHPYLLCDYIPGQSLTKKQVLDATTEQRIELFSDLISIYSQFFKLRFPVAGSLLPDTTRHASSPHVGGLLSMARSELQVTTGHEPARPKIRCTTEKYMKYQLDSVSKSARLPLIDGTLSDVRDQVFALYHLKLKTREIMRNLQSDDSDTFILTHPDLHYANIIVDECLKIQGIIDWEFAGTVPQHLFTPPAWMTGHDGRERLQPPKVISDDFQKALQLSKDEELKSHWRMDDQCGALFATAQIFSHPTKLERLFYQSIFPAMFRGGKDQDEVISRFFDDGTNAALAADAERQLGSSERYTAYLKESGLYADMEEDAARSAEIRAGMHRMPCPDK